MNKNKSTTHKRIKTNNRISLKRNKNNKIFRIIKNHWLKIFKKESKPPNSHPFILTWLIIHNLSKEWLHPRSEHSLTLLQSSLRYPGWRIYRKPTLFRSMIRRFCYLFKINTLSISPLKIWKLKIILLNIQRLRLNLIKRKKL